MNPLIPLALQLAPALAKRVLPDRAGNVAEAVIEVVQDVVGTDDAGEAAQAITDPAVAAQLQLRLAAIEADAEAKERADHLADIRNARGTMVELQRSASALAWGPVVVSAVVVSGFFATLLFLIYLIRNGGGDPVDQQVIQIVNIAVGTLAAGFATVISFWLGSSNGSQKKDAAMRGLP